MRKYPFAPHPYVLIPPLEDRNNYQPGEKITFFLTLIGRAIDYLPYFIYTFNELGERGIGRGRGKYQLNMVDAYDTNGRWVLIYQIDDRRLNRSSFRLTPGHHKEFSSKDCLLTLNLETPTRIVYQGRLSKELDFHVIVRNLLRRVSLLSYFHCGLDISDLDFHAGSPSCVWRS